MRRKLFLAFTLIVVLTVVLVAVIARRGAVNEVRTFMFRGGMYGLSDLATELENYYHTQGSWENVQSIIDIVPLGMGGMNGMMRQRVLVADASGNVVADSQRNALGRNLDQLTLAGSIPLIVDRKTVGYLSVAGGMGFDTGNEQLVLGRLNRGVVIAGLLAGALGLVLAMGLAYTLLRPVRELTLAARKLSEGDLSQRVAIHGDDELATLGHAFNQMADSLQQAEESRRALTADIAHELRTPLAVQRANLEAFQDGVYPLTVENLTPVIEQNHLLTHLVEDLRTLALADAGQIELERTDTDLVSLADRVVEQFQPQAATHQVKLVFLPASTSIQPISLDPIRVEQMLSNLLSNAMRYTPPGGQIEVAITLLLKVVRLTVHDSGPGIPEEALPFIFERFYRADKSRSRAEGGSGLGLAIARNLARAHGGDLTATNHASGGALFTLTLPIGSIN
jgi:two-component system, OmpR family, sensor histidine kinase BaeS